MRISHLRQREPIDRIIETTLSRFWSHRFGQSFHVEWNQRIPQNGSLGVTVPWICNAWLNAIFPPHVQPAALGPTLREYARSTVAWRRPLQRLYVQLATTQPLAPWMAHGRLCVTPAVPNQENTVIIPGNNKLRVLDHSQNQCHSILKADFPEDHFRRELASRLVAWEVGLPVPELIECNDAQGWFCERYLAGTPLNRLADKTDQQRFLIAAAGHLHALLQHTAELVETAEYVTELVSRLNRSICHKHLLDERTQTALLRLVEQLAQRLRQRTTTPARLITALTHGDFQPGNLLVDERGVWIIDWEYSNRRQAGFDALVALSQPRSPAGLAARLRQLLDRPGQGQQSVLAAFDAPGLTWRDQDQRNFHVDLFWLEELDFHLLENSNGLFRQLNHGFAEFLRELECWLA